MTEYAKLRIGLVGTPCAGKSDLSDELQRRLDLPVITNTTPRLDPPYTVAGQMEILINQILQEKEVTDEGFIADSTIVDNIFYCQIVRDKYSEEPQKQRMELWTRCWDTFWERMQCQPYHLLVLINEYKPSTAAFAEEQNNGLTKVRTFLDLYSDFFGFRALAVTGTTQQRADKVIDWLNRNKEVWQCSGFSGRMPSIPSRTMSSLMTISRPM